MGYHKKDIPKGKLYEFSKIKEEFLELEDAYEQGDIILQLCELSDLIGAIDAYIGTKGLTIEDLKKFSDKTVSAFKEGKRSSDDISSRLFSFLNYCDEAGWIKNIDKKRIVEDYKSSLD